MSHRPSWNDVRVVQAMLSLTAEALKDPKTTHIIFGTESCIPIAPLSAVRLETGKSYMAYYGKDGCTRFDERDVWDVVRQYVPLDAIHKALPGWCVLSRSAAQDILDMPQKHLGGNELWTAFKDCWAPEEAFFPTALALLGHLPATINKSMTYAEWDSRARNQKDRAHPKVWDTEFCKDLVTRLRKDHGCFVLRKVRRRITLTDWQRAIDTDIANDVETKKRNNDGVNQNHQLQKKQKPL